MPLCFVRRTGCFGSVEYDSFKILSGQIHIFILCIRLAVSQFLQVASFSPGMQFPINLDLPKQLRVQNSTRIFCWSQCLDLNGFGTLSQKASSLGWIDGWTLRKDSFSKQVLCLDDWVESTPVKAEIHRFIEQQLVFEHAIDIDLHYIVTTATF